MKLSTEQQQNLLNSLPEQFKRAIIRFDWKREIMGIGHIFELSSQQLESLETQTFLMMTGELSSDNFEKTIVDHMNISDDSAGRIMNMINTSIFAKLQERVAQSPQQDEQIDHDEIKNVMKLEGIELVDETEIKKIDNPLNNEISAILSGVIQPESNSFDDNYNEPLTDNYSTSEMNLENSNTKTQEKVVSYNEPIDDTDLKGIQHHQIDTSVLTQENLTNNDAEKKPSLPSLDKHLFENSFISKGDTIDLSPSKEEQITENGDFLKHLKATE